MQTGPISPTGSDVARDETTVALEALIQPSRIAVVGASPRPNHFANTPIANLRRYGFTGEIYPVNPQYPEVMGMRCYPSISDLPGVPDLALVVIRQALTVDIVKECAAAGVPAAIVVASGFAETGESDGIALQAELSRVAAEQGIRVCGPNTLGIANFNGNTVSFVSGNLPEQPIKGSVAVVSQSGGCGFTMVNRAWNLGVGIGHLAVVGNEADIGLAELVAYYLSRDDVGTVLCYMEAVRDPAGLRHVGALSVAAGKPVFVMKTGSSPQGQRAAAAHTGALATADSVFSAALQEWGLGRASTFDSLIAAGALTSRFAAPQRGAVGVYTQGGGLAVVAADLFAGAGITLPPISPGTADQIKHLMPDTTPGNPFDSGGQFLSSGVDLLVEGLSAFAADPNLDVIVHCAMPVLGHRQQVYCEGIARVATASPKPNVVLQYGAGSLTEPADAIFGAAGLLVVDPPEAGAEAVKLWLDSGRRRPPRPSAPLRRPDAVARQARRLLSGWQARGPAVVGEHQAVKLLDLYGLPVARQVVIATPDEAPVATAALRAPYVVKVASSGLAHRSDFGGVIVGIGDASGVAGAVDTVMARARAAHPQATIEGAIVAEMAPAGTELIAGIQRDPSFGPVVMLGLGGVWAETLNDTALRLPPIDEGAAMEMLQSLRGAALLFGGRGQAALDVGALVAVIVALGELALDAGDLLQSLDVNPLIAHAGGLVAVDALAELSPGA
jgi:acyl-CoA synthetase (NDP forming)